MTKKKLFLGIGKTKCAGILSAVGLFLPSAIEWLNTGDITPLLDGGYKALIALLAIFGIRDALE